MILDNGDLPIEEPRTKRRAPRKKMSGSPSGKERHYGLALTPREPAPNCPIRTIDDIPERFRKPTKPPGRK
jgi:hypothetical protein